MQAGMKRIGPSLFVGSVIGVGVGTAIFETEMFYKRTKERNELFNKIASTHLKMEDDFSGKSICDLIKSEREFCKVEKEIEGNLINQLKNAIFGYSENEKIEGLKKALPEDISLTLEMKLLAQPCGWNSAYEGSLRELIEMGKLNSSDLLEHNNQLADNIVNIWTRVLKIRMEEEKKHLTPDQFSCYSARLIKMHSTAIKGLEDEVSELKELETALKSYLKFNNPFTAVEKHVLQQVIYKKNQEFEKENLLFQHVALICSKAAKAISEEMHDDAATDTGERRIACVLADYDMVVASEMAYFALAQCYMVRGVILDVPKRRFSDVE